MEADQNETMEIFLDSDFRIAPTGRLIQISERIKHVLSSKLEQPSLIKKITTTSASGSEGFPLDITSEIEKFAKRQRLEKKQIFELNT